MVFSCMFQSFIDLKILIDGILRALQCIIHRPVEFIPEFIICEWLSLTSIFARKKHIFASFCFSCVRVVCKMYQYSLS